MTDSHEVSRRLELAKTIAISAGQLTLQHFRSRSLEIIEKSDGSPVTIADQQAETHLREIITEVFPEDSIVGEEFGRSEGESGFCWVLDPIDGTKSFISGVPLYGTMVAVMDYRSNSAGDAIIGAVHMPGLDEGIYAASGQGAWYYQGKAAPQPARVSTTSELRQGVLLTSAVDGFALREDCPTGFLEKLSSEFRFCRTWGDVYGYLLVATGRADVMIDPELHLWDAAAVYPIITEAGGKFTAWNGQSSVSEGDGIGSNGLLHSLLLEKILSHREPRPT